MNEPVPFPPSPALLTDLYQITMAYGYWKTGMAEREAVFHLTFRSNPFGGGFCIACGLGYLVEYIRRFRFEPDDIDYILTFTGNNGRPLFEPEFADYLSGISISCNIEAVPEGTAVFPREPVVRVRGPLAQCQLLETPLLNMINFQTLIATKAARVCLATRGEPVLEFGMRRAQGFDGALAASRAAYIGGCAGTSNVLAGKLFDIPVKGTHAHSWVMAFPSETEAFEAYAGALPNNCIFLVDTYDTIDGVRNAIETGKKLRESGHEMIGIRLDSGDLAALSAETRRMLDDAGFRDAAIVASGDLDEYLIGNLKEHGAAANVWGVGTRMVTGHGDPALNGIYKLSAIRGTDGKWEYRMKLSEEAGKRTLPGVLQVRRYSENDRFIGDAIYNTEMGIGDPPALFKPENSTVDFTFPPGASHEDLLVPVFSGERLVYESPSVHDLRRRALDQIRRLPPEVIRLEAPSHYPVGYEARLGNLVAHLTETLKKGAAK
jgi:nicotinate phosphoribosyltransferase